MSELSSLFVRISISKENFEAFLSAPPQKPFLDNSWINWWNSREMYSPQVLTPEDLYAYNNTSNKEILDGWQSEKNTGTFYEYDEATQTLNLGIIFFSENFEEMIPMLAFVIDLANYKNDNPDDFAIVYPFFWGDKQLDVWITFYNKNAILDNQLKNINEIDPGKFKYAEDYLTQKSKQIFQQD